MSIERSCHIVSVVGNGIIAEADLLSQVLYSSSEKEANYNLHAEIETVKYRFWNVSSHFGDVSFVLILMVMVDLLDAHRICFASEFLRR